MIADFVLGVDPGLGGALALYKLNASIPTVPLAQVYDMPCDGKMVLGEVLSSVVHCWANHREVLAVVEKVGSRPRQAGAFNFGMSTGIVHGVLAAHGIKVTTVTPQEWKGAMGLLRHPDETQPENKSRARALAAQLFPAMADQFKRVRDDGRAEALLLAVYFANRRK